ncbi:hypothetical protein GOODEAATRI_033197, partial [Goodea atripinnis]
ANVYHASTAAGDSRAIKIYKTSILLFKDRDKYVSGEFRFRHGYCKGNPRKMVRTWAEKEMRNLIRLDPQASTQNPIDLNLRTGCNMPEPWLVDRRNCWYHSGDAYIIDVSQSVEHDHPHALEFLRKDCSNINGGSGLASRLGQAGLVPFRELFDFVTDPSITSRNIEQYLDKVFKMAYIPRTLTEVSHYERDVELMRLKEEESAISGHHDNVLYQTLTGLKKDLSGVQMVRFFSFCLCCWSNTS